MVRRGGMEQVELLDADGDGSDVEHDPAPARPGRVRWLVVGAAAVVLSLVGTQWVVDAREDAAVARLAAVPGVLPEIGDELTVARVISPDQVSTLWNGFTTAGGAMASLVVAADGSQAVTAIDPLTSETVWSTPLLGPNADRAAARDSSYGGWCSSDAVGGEAAELAVCLASDGFVRYGADGTEERLQATTTRAVVLDTADGRVVHELEVGDAARIAVIPGLLLVGLGAPQQGIEVVAHDLRTGDERWRYRTPAVTDGPPDDELAQSWHIARAGDHAALYDGVTLRLLSRTGSLVRDDLRGSGDGFGSGPDQLTGNLAVTTYDGGTKTTRLLTADADPAGDVVVEGSLVPMTVDDGSVPGLVLTTVDHLHAWDRATGDEVWESDLLPLTGVVVARGRVVLATATSVVALDGRTGHVVWEQQTPQSAAGFLATDARDVLVPTPADGVGGAAGITGYDLVSGERTRHVAYPEGVSEVWQVGRLLIGFSTGPEEVTLLE